MYGAFVHRIKQENLNIVRCHDSQSDQSIKKGFKGKVRS